MRTLYPTYFRNLDGPSGTIAKVLESLRLRNYPRGELSNVVCLAVVGRGYSDSDVRKINSRLLDGEQLWVFSTVPRSIQDASFKVTHVPASSTVEFERKIATHIERYLQETSSQQKNGSGAHPSLELNFSSEEPFAPLAGAVTCGSRQVGTEKFFYLADLRRGSKFLVVEVADDLGKDSVSGHLKEEVLGFSFLRFAEPACPTSGRALTGWWLGSEKHDYVRSGAVLAQDAASMMSIRPDRIIFTGVGIGGFAALAMASEVRGSRAVVDNAAFELEADWLGLRSVRRAAKRAFGQDMVPESHKYRVSLRSRFARNGYVPRFFASQNQIDLRRYEEQFLPFKDSQSYSLEKLSPCGFVTYRQRHLSKEGNVPLKPAARARLILMNGMGEQLPDHLESDFVFRD